MSSQRTKQDAAIKQPKQKKSVFVIMPFSSTPARDESALTEFFLTNIKQPIEACKKFKNQYTVRRSDDTFDITARIISDIYAADIVICDLSGEHANPNVMYELGMRLSLTNKPVILIREKCQSNKKIFDIAGFFAFEYGTQHYRIVEEHIIKKILNFENGVESFESPVLKQLKNEPTIISEIRKSQAIALLSSFTAEIVGLQRVFSGNLANTLKKAGIQHEITEPRDAVLFMRNNIKELQTLDWASIKFVPRIPPAMQGYLVQLPLTGLVQDRIAIVANTLTTEIYNLYFSLDTSWSSPNLAFMFGFMHETQLLLNIIYICGSIVEGDMKDNDEALQQALTFARDSKLIGKLDFSNVSI